MNLWSFLLNRDASRHKFWKEEQFKKKKKNLLIHAYTQKAHKTSNPMSGQKKSCFLDTGLHIPVHNMQYVQLEGFFFFFYINK